MTSRTPRPPVQTGDSYGHEVEPVPGLGHFFSAIVTSLSRSWDECPGTVPWGQSWR